MPRARSRRGFHSSCAASAAASLKPYLVSTAPLTEDRAAMRDAMRRFVRSELEPHVLEWERRRAVPRELYTKAGAAGLLGVGMPEEYGQSVGRADVGVVEEEEEERGMP